jgi:uncharacterized protein (TIGR03437 family)
MFRTIFVAGTLMCASAWAQSTNYVASAEYSFRGPTAVAPGQIITLFVRNLNVPNAVADRVPLPTTLSGITVAVKDPPTPGYPTALPIFSVRSYPDACSGGNVAFCNNTAVTVQFPFEPTCIPTGGIPNECTIGVPPPIKLVVQASGSIGQEFWLSVVFRAPHFLHDCDAMFGRFGGCLPFITHADGTPVSTAAPAHPAEIVTLYAVGLGPTRNARTGHAASSADPIASDLFLTSSFRMDSPPGSPAPPVRFVDSGQWIKADYAGLVQGFVGLYQINARVPDTLPEGIHQCESFLDTNVRLMFGPLAEFLFLSNTEFVDLCVRR